MAIDIPPYSTFYGSCESKIEELKERIDKLENRFDKKNLLENIFEKEIKSKIIDSPCPIANSVAAQVLKRAEIGFKKYGTNAARIDLSTLDWFQHLQEELLDAAVYIERLKQDIKN